MSGRAPLKCSLAPHIGNRLMHVFLDGDVSMLQSQVCGTPTAGPWCMRLGSVWGGSGRQGDRLCLQLLRLCC